MNPHQKATSLIEKYTNQMLDHGYMVSKPLVKLCALIAVDEILFCDAIFHATTKETKEERNYWEEVKYLIKHI